jgi:hypothetical protein
VERIFQHDNGIGKDIKTLTITFVIRWLERPNMNIFALYSN